MNRHDPLSSLAPATEAEPAPLPPAPTKPKGKKKLPPLLRDLAEVSDNTLAFLMAGPDQKPGDYARQQRRASEIRAEFTTFCEAHPEYAQWRQAWAAFYAGQQAFRASLATVPVTFPKPAPQQPVNIVALPVQTPALATRHSPPVTPLWQQRARQRAALLVAAMRQREAALNP